MTLKTRIYEYFKKRNDESTDLIIKLTDKLAIARKALVKCRYHAAKVGNGYNPEIQYVVNEALELTDIEQEQPE